jgi:hypothetical protein
MHAGTTPNHDSLPDTAWTLGWAGLVAMVVPPGLIVAPPCGLAATLLGAIGLGRAEGEQRDRALIGMALGVITLLAYATLIVLFHNAIARVLHDINFG